MAVDHIAPETGGAKRVRGRKPPRREPLVCWTLTSGEAGMVSQAVGLAEAVGYPFEVKTLQLHRPWRWLPGHLCPGVFRALTADSDPLEPPWPDLLITSGRRSVAPALAIKRRSGGRTTTVHIQNPQVPPRYFDLVVPMEHDRVKGANVHPVRVALHRGTRDKLEQAAERFRQRFAALPRPRLAVLIGGSNDCYSFTPGAMARLAGQLADLAHRAGVGLMITTSRRTGAEQEAILRKHLEGAPAEIWDGTGENPYWGMLALADHIAVTCDSVSMISEACSTGKPVSVVPLRGGSARFRRFHRALEEAGVARPFAGRLETWSYPPLNETPAIARTVRQLVAARRKSWQR